MVVKPNFGNIESINQINEIFALDYSGQDWDLVNANSKLVDDFISYYLQSNNDNIKIAIFELIISSIDELEDNKLMRSKLDLIKNEAKQNVEKHLGSIIYWSSFGTESDDKFPISLNIRQFLNEVVSNIDEIKISAPEIYGIQLNNIELLEIIGTERLNLVFEELIKEMGKSNRIEIRNREIMELEYDERYVHLSFYGLNRVHYYFRFEKNKFENELGKNWA